MCGSNGNERMNQAKYVQIEFTQTDFQQCLQTVHGTIFGMFLLYVFGASAKKVPTFLKM